jgi:hypothetical protein
VISNVFTGTAEISCLMYVCRSIISLTDFDQTVCDHISSLGAGLLHVLQTYQDGGYHSSALKNTVSCDEMLHSLTEVCQTWWRNQLPHAS